MILKNIGQLFLLTSQNNEKDNKTENKKKLFGSFDEKD